MRLINQIPSRGPSYVLACLPFIILLVVYFMGSDARLAVNPDDKLLPSFGQMVQTIKQYAFEENVRTGSYLFWDDTFASLKRLFMAMAVAVCIALVLGIGLGVIPLISATFSSFVAVISMIPPLAILPILFIVFGLDELSKVMLIVLGIAPVMIRDLEQRAREIPKEWLIKVQTLGANTWTLILRVVLPQLLPRLFIALRLALGSAWLFLIAAEAIASTEGLGYRIFLVRRYMAMDVILPYVAWITLLAWLMDSLLKRMIHKFFPWHGGQ
jgi:NitT/TauT family transport system permease protein